MTPNTSTANAHRLAEIAAANGHAPETAPVLLALAAERDRLRSEVAMLREPGARLLKIWAETSTREGRAWKSLRTAMAATAPEGLS